MRTRRSCGVLLVRGEPVREFLLMKHSNRWDLPKGHVDDGETDIECALREMEEETGIDRANVEIDPGFRFTTKYPVSYKRFGDEVFEKTLVVFLGRVNGENEIAVTEHQGYQWFVWQPPHVIQKETIDPLLAQLAEYL